MTDNLPATTTQADIVSQFGTMSGFDLLQRQAKMLASSSLVPEQFSFFDKNGKLKDAGAQAYAVANSVIALEIAHRIAASPLVVAQNLVVIYGRPTWSSQFVIAAINACGRFSALRFRLTDPEPEKEVPYTYTEGYGQNKQTKTGKARIQNRTCVAWANDRKTGDILEGPAVSIEMAVKEGWYTKSGSKWQTMPDLMLRYRAAAFFGRLYAPDLLMGMRSVDEAIDIGDDVIDVKPEPTESKIADINAEIKQARKAQHKKAPESPAGDEQPATKANTQAEPQNATTGEPQQPAQEKPVVTESKEIPPAAETAQADVQSSQAEKEPAAGTGVDLNDTAPRPEMVAKIKAELDAITDWQTAYKWEDKNRARLLKDLPNEADRGEVGAYANFIMHLRQIDEKQTVEGVNQWADMKMGGLLKQFESRHHASAKTLFERVQKHALAKIEELRGETKETPPSQLSAAYLRYQEQLYSKESTVQLDQWAFATNATREKQLSADEHAALMDEIGERRAELKAIEDEQK